MDFSVFPLYPYVAFINSIFPSMTLLSGNQQPATFLGCSLAMLHWLLSWWHWDSMARSSVVFIFITDISACLKFQWHCYISSPPSTFAHKSSGVKYANLDPFPRRSNTSKQQPGQPISEFYRRLCRETHVHSSYY